MTRGTIALMTVLAVLSSVQASELAPKCAAAAIQLGACRSPPLAVLAPAATETACCKPFLELLLSDCFCSGEASGLAHAALTQDAALLILKHCPVTTFETPCGNFLQKAAEVDSMRGQQEAFLQHLQTDMEDRAQLGAKFEADLEQYPELQAFLKPTSGVEHSVSGPRRPSFRSFPAWIQSMSAASSAASMAVAGSSSQPPHPEDPPRAQQHHGMTPETLRELLGSDPHAADYLQPQASSMQLRRASQQAQQAAQELRAAFGQQSLGGAQIQSQDSVWAMGQKLSQEVGHEAVMGQLHKASRTVDAVAGYLKALGDSTSDATAIDLDVGVTSQPADQDSVFRVQESADGTSFVLEFTLDADDTEAEQLVQAGYQILAGDAPRENDDFARQFKSKDMRKVAGALEELFESVAKRGKALRAANPTTFQMDLTVAVANEDGGPRQEQVFHQGAGEAESLTDLIVGEDSPRLLAVQDLSVFPVTEEERQFLCALEAGDATPCRRPHSPLSPAWLSFLAWTGVLTRLTALTAVVAILAATARKIAVARRAAASSTGASKEVPAEEPLLKPFAPESAFFILPDHKPAHYSPV